MQEEIYKNQFTPWKQGHCVALPDAPRLDDLSSRKALMLSVLNLRIALIALNGNKYGRIMCALNQLKKPSE